MTEVERRFILLQLRIFVRIRQLALYSMIGQLGVESYKRGLWRYFPPTRAKLQKLLKHAAGSNIRLLIPLLPVRSKFRRLARSLLDAHAERGENVIRSAGLVFTHSMVEDVAESLIRLTALIDYTLWVPQIRAKKVAISELRAGPEAIERSQVDAFMQEGLRNRSLPEKIDLLHQKVGRPNMDGWRAFFETHRGRLASVPAPPGSFTFDDLLNWKYDETELRRIDGVRHSVVHRLDFSLTAKDTQQIEHWLWVLSIYLVYIVGTRWSLPSVLALKDPSDLDITLDDPEIREFASAFFGRDGLDALVDLLGADDDGLSDDGASPST